MRGLKLRGTKSIISYSKTTTYKGSKSALHLANDSSRAFWMTKTKTIRKKNYLLLSIFIYRYEPSSFY